MTYKGPRNIPLELAENLIEALNPILDLLAEEPSLYRNTSGYKHKLEENRWTLWRAVQIAHEAVTYSGGTQVWRCSPIRRRHDNDKTANRFAIPWHQLRCGRLTKKGEPCKLRLRHGRAHCWRHSTQEDNEELRIWQDKIHLPYPRVDVGRFVFDINEVIEGLQDIAGDLSDSNPSMPTLVS